MDIYHFIESKSIIDHLKKIQYEFTSLECAKIVYRSEVSLKEKHTAWREIIDTMPDCQILDTKADRDISLHQYLEKLIACQKTLLEIFYRQDGEAYTYAFFNTDNQDFRESYDIFFSFVEAFEKAKEEIEIWEADVKDNLYIEKIFRSSQVLRLKTNVKGQEMDIMLDEKIEEDMIEYAKTLDLLAFVPAPIPTPFEKGDILHLPYGVEKLEFVLTNSEMTEGITIYSGEVANTLIFESELEWEYLQGPLTSDKRELQYISDYLKEKIDLVSLINLCKLALIERMNEDLKAHKEKLSISDYIKELYGL